MIPNICPYCLSRVEFKDSEVIYGQSYGMVYICSKFPECDAYVGVHRGTKEALGSLANYELREKRKETHAWFDKLWQNKKMTRHETYKYLQKIMNMSKKRAHIAKFNIEQCEKLIEFLRRNKTPG